MYLNFFDLSAVAIGTVYTYTSLPTCDKCMRYINNISYNNFNLLKNTRS